jgi:hypothetical protein
MAVVFYIFYSLFCFGSMPMHALYVVKNKLLLLCQISLSIYWAYMIFGDYLRDMPEGENGSVIVGMFVVIPIICFLSQIIFWLIFITFQKLIQWCKLAYNK